MTESTIDMDRAMQGIDCEVITWTKCSDRMPFRQDVIVTLVGDLKTSGHEYNRWNSKELKEQFLKFPAASRKFWKANTLWTPYTPEVWTILIKSK